MHIDPLERLYNRNYGLPNAVRRKILEDAAVTSVKQAAQDHKVAAGTVYLWRRHIRAYQLGWDDCVASAANMKNKESDK